MDQDFPIRNQVELRHYFELHDALTLLRNSKALRADFPEWQSKFAVEDKLGVILAIDLDAFKKIGDHYGMVQADQVLVEIAKRLLTEVPTPSRVYRIGGDEFACLVANLVSESEIISLLMRLQAISESLIYIGDGTWDREVEQYWSIGATYWSDQEGELEHLMGLAFRGLSATKSAGGAGHSIVLPD